MYIRVVYFCVDFTYHRIFKKFTMSYKQAQLKNVYLKNLYLLVIKITVLVHSYTNHNTEIALMMS